MASTYPTPKRIILCVDDDEAMLGYERALLERSGYVVLTTASPKQALKFVTACKCDVVLLDYDMPEMNGNELACAIKQVRPEQLVILVSGREAPTHALKLVDAFVPKLEASEQLLPMIAQLCSRTRDRQQRASDS
jgi:CheY-like chemotaxis protein